MLYLVLATIYIIALTALFLHRLRVLRERQRAIDAAYHARRDAMQAEFAEYRRKLKGE